MAVEMANTDLVGKRLEWLADLELGSKTFGNSVTRTSAAVRTRVPMNCAMKVKLTSGELNVLVSVHDGTPDFTGAPEVTADDTEGRILEFQTTEENPYFSIRTISGVAGAVVETGGAEAKGLIASGQGYHECGRGFNALGTDGTYSDAVA